MKTANIKRGSALIMTVVLTVLLALVGALFVMGARIDKMATSSISENKELVAGVDAVIEKISQVLVEDTPGVAGEEYYDYPGPDDPWLASLEPEVDDNDTPVDPNDDTYYWPSITDIYRKLGTNAEDLDAEIINDYQHHTDVNDSDSGINNFYPADADGDGVADAVWIKLDNINTAKGKPIYAAVRIIDHGAMLNVNTAYKFDPAVTDGSSQLHINLAALARVADDVDELDASRVGPGDSLQYESGVIWQPVDPCVPYTPFDISDELELRNRYFLTTLAKTRLEAVWNSTIGHSNFKRVPYDGAGLYNEAHWFRAINQDANQPDRRHFLTTYNFDRIINPDGRKMVNVNADDVNDLYQALLDGVDANEPGRVRITAQLAVNIVDFRDGDAEVTVYPNPDDGKTYYGFEAQPFISEIGIIIAEFPEDFPQDNHFAVELYNPFNVPVPLQDFTLSLCNPVTWAVVTDITFEPDEIVPAKGYFVVGDDTDFFDVNSLAVVKSDPNLKLSANYGDSNLDGEIDWHNYHLVLKRKVNGSDLYLDKQKTVNGWFVPNMEKYFQRDNTGWRTVYQTISEVNEPGSLGEQNNIANAKRNYNLALANADFVTVGDIALPLIIGPGTTSGSTIGEQLTPQPEEKNIRLDLANLSFANIFRYLTAFPPVKYISEPNETRIKGRININTAPWFVIAQLPWMTNEIAQAIVAYRDKGAVSGDDPNYTGRPGQSGFESIGELNFVTAGPDEFNIGKYALDPNDLTAFPDLTHSDGVGDDFEERDVIFSRISNLVTVRSDVFCAYILVRLGTDGPQKRVMAILDRSGVSQADDKVKIVAWHPVPDPR